MQKRIAQIAARALLDLIGEPSKEGDQWKPLADTWHEERETHTQEYARLRILYKESQDAVAALGGRLQEKDKEVLDLKQELKQFERPSTGCSSNRA